MNKNDLIGVVADGAGITKAQAGEAVDAVFEALIRSCRHSCKRVRSIPSRVNLDLH